MKRIMNIVLVFLSALVISCNSTDPPDNGQIQLLIEDISCTEVWLKLSSGTQGNFALTRDDKEIMQINLTSTDTIIFDDSLLPNKTYTYRVSSIEHSESSALVSATTMDTTSHNFTWQSCTFGEHSNSYLLDVAIINENNIWAVGAIYMNDSLGNPDPLIYNIIHWDGVKWEMKRVTVLYKGNYITPILYGILSFSEKEIWLSSGVPIKGDGKNWVQYHLFDLGVLMQDDGYLTKMWGISSADLYFVGTLGTIVHYQNGSWQKIESGTKLNINDIWGDYDPNKDEHEVIAVASNILESLEKEVIKIDVSSSQILNKTGINGTLSSLWFKSNKKYYLGGGGIYEKNYLQESHWRNNPFDITTYYTYKLRGQNFNDIAAAGGVGEVLHYNGLNWISFFDNTRLSYGNYYAVAIKENLIIAVGEDASKAVITIGNR